MPLFQYSLIQVTQLNIKLSLALLLLQDYLMGKFESVFQVILNFFFSLILK